VCLPTEQAFAFVIRIGKTYINEVGSMFISNTFTLIPHNTATYIRWKRIYYKQNTEALVVASKETGLVVIAEKTKYSFVSRVQNVGGSHNVKNDNSSFERAEKFICLGTTLTN